MSDRVIREDEIELSVVAWAEDNGWLARKMQYIGRAGCPDHIFVGYGRTIWIEFKKPDEEPDPKQAREHRRFRAAGVTVFVIDNVRDGVDVLLRAMGQVVERR